MRYYIKTEDKTISVEFEKDEDSIIAHTKDITYRISIDKGITQIRSALIEQIYNHAKRKKATKLIEFGWERQGKKYDILLNGINYKLEISRTHFEGGTGITSQRPSGRSIIELKAPIPGMISSINVKVGEKVKEGQHLLTLNAMKLENEITSPSNGLVKTIYAKVGTPVEKDEMLIVISNS